MILLKIEFRCDADKCGAVYQSIIPLTPNGWPAKVVSK
jgi:hypothetical protein